ncbi:MAG: UDP-N-acetylmuramate--L-alanine ligase [Clostridia bacterium]|nr:UDP-N-acetylmuramate--L-alanine ligase [Clostridia bacterium]
MVRYFFVGIGGVAMSALAKLLFMQGNQVAGSDAVESVNTKELLALNIPVYIGHSAENMQYEKVDYLVINGAIADNNPELLYARKHDIKIIYRETLLAEIAANYQNVVAVAGCHGKSSTTAMIGEIFKEGGRQPTVHNGVQNNLQIGNNQWFITEACEFRKSFLKLNPYIAVITNVDADHLDCYQDLNEIKTCFERFAGQSEIVVKNATDANSALLFGKLRTVPFGLYNGDVHAKNIRQTLDGGYSFEIVINSKVFGSFYHIPTFTIHVPGLHNVLNALGAITCALLCQIDLSSIQRAIANYRGIARRVQRVGKIGSTPIILDYAHHPREISTTIKTARNMYGKFLLVFQPHTYTRTISLWDDFIQVLGTVPDLVVYKTFAARGKTIVGGRGLDLSRHLKVKYIASVETLSEYLKTNSEKYNAIVLCGAGDVVSGEFLKKSSFVTFD